MFQSLTERLNRAVRKLTGRGRISEDNVRDTVRQIRMALLEADVALPVTKAIVDRVLARALGTEVAASLDPGQAFVKIVNDELVAVLGGEAEAIKRTGRPSTILLVGLQGAGKTTTAAKLGRLLNRDGRQRVLLVSTDVYRPAARAQLETLAKSLELDCFTTPSDDPVTIASEALAAARDGGFSWLIVDTAGRLHVDEALMGEVGAISAAVSPSETLFIVDAMAGQDAVNAARVFHEKLALTGAILTKADGDSRGGAALSVREVTGVPIKLVGTGEKPDALEAFVPRRMASRILGMGDVVGLVEAFETKVDREVATKVASKVQRGRGLNLEDFRTQLEQLNQLGGVGALIDKLPGINPEAVAQAGAFDERQIRRQIAIINSMTPKERRQPQLIDGSRKRRIAAGAGLPIQDVNRLLKQHKVLAKTMKRVAQGGGMQRMLGGMLAGRGGPRRPGR